MAKTQVPGGYIEDDAITTAKIADNTIQVAHLHSSHGITTNNIAEHTNNKYYTDARVDTRLAATKSSNFVTTGNLLISSDTGEIKLGAGPDLFIKHNGADSYMENYTGDLYIKNFSDNKDIIFETDNGSGGTTKYLEINGSEEQVVFYKESEHQDNVKAKFGNGGDLQLFHDQSNSINYIQSYTSAELRLESNGNTTIRTNNGDNMAVFTKNGAVTLYHDDSPKLATTSTGVSVTGGANTTGTVTVTATHPTLFLQTTGGGTTDAAYLQKYNDHLYLYNKEASGALYLGTNNGTKLTINSAGDATFANNVIVTGNLTVNGTSTTLNTATLDVEDKNITLNKGSGDTSSTADGAGITIQDAVDASTDATFNWQTSNDSWNLSHVLNVPRIIQTVSTESQFYAVKATRSSSGTSNPDFYGGGGTLVLGTSASDERLALTTSGVSITGSITSVDGITFSDGGDRTILGPLNEDLILNARPNDSTEGLHLQINGTDKLFINNAGNSIFSGAIAIGGTSTNSQYGVYLQNNKWYATQYSSSHDIVRMNANTAGGLDIYNQTDSAFAVIRTGGVNIGSTQVISGSRNLINIGTIASGVHTISTSSPDTTNTLLFLNANDQFSDILASDDGGSVVYRNDRGNFKLFVDGTANSNSTSNSTLALTISDTTAATFVGNVTAPYLATTSYIDLNNSGNRGKIGWSGNHTYIATTSSVGSIIFKNNVSSGAAPQTGGDTLLTLSDGGNANFAGTITANGSGLTALNASNISSGELSNSRLPTSLKNNHLMAGANAILRMQETDVTNSPTWWTVADGGTWSVRLNNTGTYPISIATNTNNNAVSQINIGYTTIFGGNIVGGDIKASSSAGLTLQTDEGTKRIEILDSGVVKFNQAYSFPTSDGSANQVLQTNGSGQLSFATVSGGGGGVSISNNADNRVLTGDGTNANAEANLTFGGTNLTIAGTGGVIADRFYFGATNSSLLAKDSANIKYMADGQHTFQTYDGGWVTKAQITDNEFKVFDGNIQIGTLGSTASGYLYLNGSTANKRAEITCTNGNLHIDADHGNGIYLNWYGSQSATTTDGVFFGNTNAAQVGRIDGVGNLTLSGYARANGWFKGASDTNTLYSDTSNGTIIQTPSNTNDAAGTFYIRDSLGAVHFSLNTNTNTSSFHSGNLTNIGTISASTLSTVNDTFTINTTTSTINSSTITIGNNESDDVRISGDATASHLRIQNGVRGVAKNYADSSGWVKDTDGFSSQTGYYGGDFGVNGDSSEQSMDYGTVPDGSQALIWTSTGDTTSGADGGWNKGISGLRDDTTYMSVTYVKRNGSSTSGNFYHGCSGSHTLNLDGSANTNPYFSAIGISNLPQDVWCVSIGYIRANNNSSTAEDSTGGLYRCDTGAKVAESTSYKMKDGSSDQTHRTYLYYSSTGTSSLSWFKPGFYEVNGLEPTVKELIDPGAGSLQNPTFNRVVSSGLYGTGHSGSTLPIWQYNSSNLGYGIGYTEGSPDSIKFDVSGNLTSGTVDFEIFPNDAKINGQSIATQSYVTSQGYLTSADGGNANLLDSLDSNDFLRLDGSAPTTQENTNYGKLKRFYCNTNMATASGSQSSLEAFSNGSGNDAFMTFHVGGDFACYFGLDGGTNKLSVGGWSMGANSYEIYHSGNKPSLATLGYTGATDANNYVFPYTISTGASVNTVVRRDGNGYIFGNYLNMTGTFANSGAGGTMGYFTGTNGSDNYGRSWTAAQARTLLNVADGATANSTESVGASNNTLVKRHSSGYVFANYFNTTANDVSSGVTKVMVETGNDNYIRHGDTAAIQAFINTSAGNSQIGASQILKSHTNAYLYTNWINVGVQGIYSGTNGAHFYPNTLGSYGTWRINGTRGGYSGIMMDGGGDVVTGMFDGSGNGGDWNNSSSWHFYYHRANDCLGISGSTTSSSYGAYVNGALYATGDIVGSSDERLKTEIKTIPNALDKVLKLRGVTYKWIDSEEGGSCVNNITETRMGVIAQEVVDILPEVVTHDKENDRYGVSYGHLTGVLIEAVKELKQEVNELKKELEEVKNG